MKSGKRILSILLALFLVFGMIVPVSAEEEVTVTDFSIEPVTMTEDADLTTLVYGDGEQAYVYDISHKNPFISLTYSNGESFTYTLEELNRNFNLNLGFPDGLEQTSQWTASETPYLITVDLYDYTTNSVLATTQAAVTIAPNPVESISVEPVTMTQHVDVTYWLDENGEEVPVYDFGNLYNPNVTITFNDGREPLQTEWWMLYEIFGEHPDYADDICDTTDWEPGQHTLTVSFMGKTCDVDVTIVENPVAAATVEPITIPAGWYEYEELIWDEETQQDVYVDIVDVWSAEPVVTITLKNGSTITKSISYLMSDYLFGYTHEQALKTSQWVPGNTYDFEMTINGIPVTLEVNYIENPVASIEAIPVTLYTSEAERNYYWDEEAGEERSFLWYYVEDKIDLLVTYTDDTTEVVTVSDLWNGGYGRVQVDYDVYQDNETPWLPGNTYTAYISCMGAEVECPITVVDDGITELSAVAQQPLYATLCEAGDLGYADILVTLKKANGDTATTPLGELYNHISDHAMVYLELEESLADGEKLAVGTYNAVLTIDDVSCTFPITVVENPIQSFKITPKTAFTENVHGWMEPDADTGEDYFFYAFEYVPFTIELTLKDGTVETYSSSSDDELSALVAKYRTGNIYPFIDQQYGDITGPGSYTLDVYFMGMKQAHTIQVVSSTVKSVAVSYDGTLLEGVDGWYNGTEDDGEYKEYFHYFLRENALTFTVTLNDGTTETLGLYDTFMGSPAYYFMHYRDDQSYETPWTVGKNTVYITFLGVEVALEVEVVKNENKELTISGENGLTLEVEKADGTVETYVAYDYVADYVGTLYTSGTLYTDKGNFNIEVYFEDLDLTDIELLYFLGLYSNTLADCDWFINEINTGSIGSAPKADLDVDHNELKELTEQEDATRVFLQVSDISKTVASTQEALLEKALEEVDGYQLDAILDLSLIVEKEDAASDKVTQLDQPLTIRLALPKALAALENLLDVDVLRIHDGEVTLLDGTLEDGVVTFQTDRFSTYALVYSAHALTKVEAKEATTTAEGVKEHYKCADCGKLFADAEAKTELTAADVVIGKLPDPSNPQTGDNTPVVMLMVLAIASGLLLAGTAAFGKKRSW